MDQQLLLNFVARSPGTIGQRMGRQVAVGMIAGGNTDAVAALQELLGPDHGTAFIPCLAQAGAPAPILRAAIRYAVTHYHRELPALIEAEGGRDAFALWCRRADFPALKVLPETIEIYRGTMGCSPVDAARGLHWSPKFDSAALFAARYADADGTGMIVLRAALHRDRIAYYLGDGVHEEIIPAVVPTSYDVIVDKDQIADGAARALAFNRALVDQGYVESPSYGTVERAAHATRARMAAAGVPRGAAIVA